MFQNIWFAPAEARGGSNLFIVKRHATLVSAGRGLSLVTRSHYKLHHRYLRRKGGAKHSSCGGEARRCRTVARKTGAVQNHAGTALLN